MKNKDNILGKVSNSNLMNIFEGEDNTPKKILTLDDIMTAINDLSENYHIVPKSGQNVTLIIGEHRLTGKMDVVE
jgi:hypothetical protein